MQRMMPAPELDPALARAYRANIRRFYLYRFLINFELWLPTWILYLQHDRGLSLTQITAMEVPFQVVGVLAQVPTGALADRWGRRLALLLGTGGFAAGIFLFGTATSYQWILCSYLVWSLSMTLNSGADTAFLHDSLAAVGREAEFGHVIGRSQAWMVGSALVAGLIGAPLAAATNLSLPILLTSGINLLAVLVVWTFKEPRRRSTAPHLPYLTVMRAAARYTLGHARLRSMIAISAALNSLSIAEIIFLQQPFLELHHVPVQAFGLFTAPVQALSVVGLLLSPRLAARYGERRLLYGIGAGVMASMLVIGLVPSLLAAAGFATLRLCTGALFPFASAYVNRHSPDDLRATVASIVSMTTSFVFAIMAPVLGLITDRSSLQAAFLVEAGAAVLLGGLAIAAWTIAERGGARAAPRPATTAAE